MQTNLKLFLLLSACLAYWDISHMIVAAIAQIQLERESPSIYQKAYSLLESLVKFFPEDKFPFVEASVIPDVLKDENFRFLSFQHVFKNPIPYRNESSLNYHLQPRHNAISMLEQSSSIFKSTKKSQKVKPSLVKSFLLRYLIHLVGDLHQPLHTSTLWSDTFRNGAYRFSDSGGHKIHLTKYNMTLHEFWDSAGMKYTGRLSVPLSSEDHGYIMKQAISLIYKFPSEKLKADPKEINFDVWIKEGKEIAESQVYRDHIEDLPNLPSLYKFETQKECERLMVLGGFRLANLLTHLLASNDA